MLTIPEEIKELFRANNTSSATQKKFRLKFYDETIDTLYPYEQLFPEESLFPSEHDVPWLTIENDRIVSESLQITEALSSNEDMTFGSCEGAELQITVFDVNEDLTGREFTLTVEIGGYEMPLGIYTVQSYVRVSGRRRRKITAYDRMQWFNVDVADWYNNLTFPMTIKNFRDSLCSYIGVSQNPTSLLFDSMQINKTIEPETLQGVDVLKAICEINGCFGHIDKTGMLKYIQLQQTGLYPSEDLFPEEDLYPSEFGGDGQPTETVSKYKQPMTYEDYLVSGIDSLTIRQEEGDIGASVGDGNNTYVIEGNFLVYGKNATDLLNIAQSLLPKIEGRVYRPANLDCNAMPWVEVGDAIIAPTRDDLVETFVMKRTMKGCQAMRDVLEATGNPTRSKQTTIHQQIIQLEGKTATIIRNVDEVSATVTDLKTYTEAQIQILSDEISLKVSKGDVSSELSLEPDKVTLSGNRLIVNSTNFKLDGNGNATFSGNITGGTINIGQNFSVDNAGNMKATNGQFSGNITGGSININNKFKVDSGGNITAASFNTNLNVSGFHVNCSVLTAGSGSSTIMLGGEPSGGSIVFNVNDSGDIENCGNINCGEINSGDLRATEIWITGSQGFWDGWSVTEEVELLHEEVFYGSDRRLKERIVSLSDTALDFIRGLKPVSFSYKADKKQSIGFIAQDVINLQDSLGTAYPLIETIPRSNMYRLNYEHFIPIIVKALQLQQAEIDSLKEA